MNHSVKVSCNAFILRRHKAKVYKENPGEKPRQAFMRRPRSTRLSRGLMLHKRSLTSRKTNNCIPVPLLPPYSLDGWILKPCKQIIACYFLFFNDVPFRLQARICISSKRAAYTGLTPTWGTSSPKCERTGEDNFHLQPGS